MVLDLDETLIHATQHPTELVDSDVHMIPAGHAFGYWIYHRPYVRQFIEALLERFEVAVWTASTRRYAEHLVPDVVEPRHLRFLWAREQCSVVPTGAGGQFDLAKDIRSIDELGYDRANVLFVDDTPERLSASPDNVVPILPFTGEPDDTALPRLLPFLVSLGAVDDVRVVDKRSWELPHEQHASVRRRRLTHRR